MPPAFVRFEAGNLGGDSVHDYCRVLQVALTGVQGVLVEAQLVEIGF
jgi:hypothetical protein